jgi:hypothetical protein
MGSVFPVGSIQSQGRLHRTILSCVGAFVFAGMRGIARIRMGSANVELAREYLRAVESMGSPENVARFYADAVEFHEFPNRIAPLGRVRGRGDLQAAYAQGAEAAGIAKV